MAETATQATMSQASGATFLWHELYVGDAEAGRDFYIKALGWEKEDYKSDMGNYPMLKANGSAVCGVMGTKDRPDMSNVPPHWAIYIGVDDVDARLEKCKNLGAKVLVDPMDIPEIGRMALLQDPQGATFWIFKGEM